MIRGRSKLKGRSYGTAVDLVLVLCRSAAMRKETAYSPENGAGCAWWHIYLRGRWRRILKLRPTP